MLKRLVPKRPFLLAVLILFTSVAGLLGGNKTASAAFAGGTGTSKDDPFIIKTAAQLNEVRAPFNSNTHYRLEADIDLSGFSNWTPINLSGGSFDGNGHTISNLKITGFANEVGLFRRVSNAEIRNIGLINVDVKGTSYVGGLVGYLQNSTVEKSYVTGKVTGTGSSSDPVNAPEVVGGLIGYMSESYFASTKILESYAAVTVTGGNIAGGLVGKLDGDAEVANSYWDSTLSPDLPADDKGMSTADMMTSGKYTGWIFSGAGPWRIVKGKTYPMHRTTFDQLLLDNLTVKQGSDPVNLDAAFASERYAYSGRVLGHVTNVDVAATLKSSTSIVKINNVDASENIALIPGMNTVSIAVYGSGDKFPGATFPHIVVDYKLEIVREDGSDDYPHRISTADQLVSIGTVADYAYGDHYVLQNDLDLTIGNWDPIGDSGHPFTGQFDGNRHVIRNLTISRSGEVDIGLFAYSTGDIQNLGLEHADVTGGESVGALVGRNAGSVSNVYANGDVTGSNAVGGLIGANTDIGTVSNAYYFGTVVGTSSVGGLIGTNSGGTVTNSYWDTGTTGVTVSAGGEGKTTAQMHTESTYIGWDFTSTWAIMNGTTYPMWKPHFDAVKLTGIAVTSPFATASLSPAFSSGHGAYTVTLDRYVTETNIAVTPADPAVTVNVYGTVGISVTKSLTPGANVIPIDITNASGYAKGKYRLTIQVPPPALTNLALPPNSNYKKGDTLTFTVTYEAKVDVVGTPRLPIKIGTDSVYAGYVGKTSGAENKLEFKYVVAEGVTDWDGIELGTAINLPAGASVTASGINAPLAFTAPDASGIKIDAAVPSIALSQTPDGSTPTNGAVTVTAAITDAGSGVTTAVYAQGNQPIAFFATDGITLTGNIFQAASNGTYTVYAKDAVGNETVQTIEVGNIFTVLPVINVTYSTTAPTYGSVTINVTAAVDGNGSGNSLSKLNWMLGSHTAADFAGGTNGDDILSAQKFTVSTNGTYTLYAKDAAGNEAVRLISVANIVPPPPSGNSGTSIPPDPCKDGSCYYLRAGEAGQYTMDGLTVTIPAGATNENLVLTMEEIKTSTLPAEAMNRVFLSSVFELLKSTGGKFLKPITLRFVFQPDKIAEDQIAIVFYYDEKTKQWVEVGGVAEGSTITAQVDHFTKFAVLAVNDPTAEPGETSPFSDMEGHWARDFVTAAVKQGIVHGFPDRTFRPDEPVTRAQFALMLANALGWEKPVDPTLTFADRSDVPEWALSAIASAVQRGYISGYPDGTLRPNDPISRAESAAIVARALQLPSPGDQATVFRDYDIIPAWAKPHVAAAGQAELFQGDEQQRFNPTANITRAEAAVVMLKIKKR